ncbi:hypothetical protein BU17DRAFT_67729 [Hysterangium stoloniferum]|nr:hypothetical protein BU17DRAFT_67729 [Hysterangium stoloniferum]
MARFTSLPIELVSGVVEKLVREFLLEHFVSPERPWNAVFTLCAISKGIRRLTQALLTSGLSTTEWENGSVFGTRSPVHAIVLARNIADKRIEATCIDDTTAIPIPPGADAGRAVLPGHDHAEAEMWWKSSPLLALYSAIREVRFVSDWILQKENYPRRLADMPRNLVNPMETVKAMEDTRLVRPALVEGAVLIASTSFGQLSASARFFNLVTVVLAEKPEWLYASFDNIDQTLLGVEGLERSCTIAMRWIDIDHPQFVKASHIHASRIVPALADFLEIPIIVSDPGCARWRTTIGVLLNAWAPLDRENYELKLEAQLGRTGLPVADGGFAVANIEQADPSPSASGYAQ